jgi:hypothetical protein
MMMQAMKLALGAGAMAVAALVAAAPAKADVIFNFVQTSAATLEGAPTPFQMSGRLVVSDEDYASGYTVNRNYNMGVVVADNFAAVKDLSFQFPGEAPGLPAFSNLPNPQSSGAFRYITQIVLSAAPSSLPTGTIFYSQDTFDFRLSTFGPLGAGSFSGDSVGMTCSPEATCAFTFSVTQTQTGAVPVPEPASLALFGLGLAALSVARRRLVARA